jgi:hypothetical protein
MQPSELPYVRSEGFPCPSCGELLTHDNPNKWPIWIGSILITIIGALHLGYRNAWLILIVPFGAFILVFLGHLVLGVLFPPPLKRVESNNKTFDNAGSLHLTDKSNGDKKTNT